MVVSPGRSDAELHIAINFMLDKAFRRFYRIQYRDNVYRDM